MIFVIVIVATGDPSSYKVASYVMVLSCIEVAHSSVLFSSYGRLSYKYKSQQPRHQGEVALSVVVAVVVVIVGAIQSSS